MSARLLVPDDTSRVDPLNLSLYHYGKALEDASLPLPIFTAISRELPTALEKPLAEAKKEENISINPVRRAEGKREEAKIAEQVPWLWFEFTPFEVGCDDLGGVLTA